MQDQQRHLAAILFTDIVGYTAMMQQDETRAVALVKHYHDVLKKEVAEHSGEVLNDYGDGSLCTFTSATKALTCAVAMQQHLQTDPIVPLRIGLHIGELFFQEGKVFGDGVNVASRIQSLGHANTIFFSKEIFDKIRNQSGFKSVFLGMFEFKNVDDPVEVFALANDGLIVPKKEEISGKLKEIKKRSGSKTWLLIVSAIIVLAIAGFFILNSLNHKKGFTGKDKSIVVLPFDNYSDQQENFINGITEEITTQLAKIADLKVIGRTSAVMYKNSKKPLDQIAEVLGVAAYLEGSVQKVGNKIRITAQLIDANTQEHIWADHYDYDGNLKDIFSMQSEVARNIAEQLHAKLTEAERNNINKKPTDNIEAYKYYRRGRFFWDTRTKISFDSAEVNYKRAIALDPEYALAYSGLADLYIYNLKGLSQVEAIPIARDFANKALSFDSTLSEALTTIGFIESAFDFDWAKSKAILEKAIRLNPNYPTAHLFYGNLLQYTGENAERGINEVKKAVALDPLSTNLNYVLGRNYYCARKYDSAFAQLKKTLTLKPDNNFAIGNLVYVLLAKKNYPEAFELIKQLGKTGPSQLFYYQTSVLSYAYGVSGDKIGAKRELEKSLAESPDQSPYFLALDFIILNDYNEALNRLEQAYKIRDLWMYMFKVDPSLDPIRNEQRFKVLMKKMNLE